MNDDAHIVAAQEAVSKIEEVIIFPLMTLLIAVALLVFLWGVYETVFLHADQWERERGRKHMLWGIIGFVVIVSAYGLLKLAGATFGVTIG